MLFSDHILLFFPIWSRLLCVIRTYSNCFVRCFFINIHSVNIETKVCYVMFSLSYQSTAFIEMFVFKNDLASYWSHIYLSREEKRKNSKEKQDLVIDLHTFLLNMYNLFNKYIKMNLVIFNLKIKIDFCFWKQIGSFFFF